MNENSKLLKKLKEYEQEHSDLDQILIQLQEKHTVDFLQIQRLGCNPAGFIENICIGSTRSIDSGY